MRAGAFAYAKRKQRHQERKMGIINSDDENYVKPESRNYLCYSIISLLILRSSLT
jgi:hypothetical protein